MSELTLLILRAGFLLLLWAFIFAIVYALRSDLFGAPVRKLKNGAAAPQATAPAQATPNLGSSVSRTQINLPATKLVITNGVAAGTEIPLDVDLITIGRSGDSTLAIVDEYTSSHHAKLTRNGDEWTLTDLDSTNGTKLGENRVTKPVRVPLNTPITIGQTTFELRA